VAVGRNDPCPCGSGKRYKHCCGKIASAAAAAGSVTVMPAAADAGVTRAMLMALIPLLQAGRHAELEHRARELTSLDPGSGGAWKALGVALELQRKDSLPALARAATLLADDAEAQANLGSALLRVGRSAEAIPLLQRALQINPGNADTHSNLGNALRAEGRKDEALASYQAAARLFPGRAELQKNLGNMLLSLGRPLEAAGCYQAALGLRPDLAELHNGLAIALLSGGRPAEAIVSARRAIDLAAGSPEAHSTLGNALLDLGLSAEAADAYRAALALEPDFADAANNLAIALRLQGRTEEAMTHVRRAIQLNPRSASTRVLLADAHADRGEFPQAEQCLREAIAIEPDSAEAWAGLAHLRTMTSGDAPWLAQAARIAAGQQLAPRMEVLLRYALGKYYDDIQQYPQAFPHYRRANELSRQHRVPYDAERSERMIDQLIRCCSSGWLKRVLPHGIADVRPVFVVGMPRSGTSLVEQILASHPLVYGAGELPFWNAAAAALTLPEPGEAFDAASLRPLAGDYLRLLSAISAGASRIVDKMPENFLHLGLIYAALPGARIIHVARHPIDTCVSIYFQDFRPSLTYATALGGLAHYYRQYWRLMQHWRSLLPQHAMLELSYEQLVAKPELISRKLLEFLELPWDARCLDFQGTRRSVVTASKWQVRQKISTASVARWRHYESFVRELLPLLDIERAPEQQ
jgi:tetratricopeptide (TPR) repeat protein